MKKASRAERLAEEEIERSFRASEQARAQVSISAHDFLRLHIDGIYPQHRGNPDRELYFARAVHDLNFYRMQAFLPMEDLLDWLYAQRPNFATILWDFKDWLKTVPVKRPSYEALYQISQQQASSARLSG